MSVFECWLVGCSTGVTGVREPEPAAREPGCGGDVQRVCARAGRERGAVRAADAREPPDALARAAVPLVASAALPPAARPRRHAPRCPHWRRRC